MKRFTETTKWSDPWFRKLKPEAKLLWLLLVDTCDNAGVVDPDWGLITFVLGNETNEETLKQLGSRAVLLPNGKVLVPSFVKFQFGTLSRDAKVHQSVFRVLDSHGLTEESLRELSHSYPIAIPCLSHSNAIEIPLQWVKEKEKEKDKDKEEEQRLITMINGWFSRRESTKWSDKEMKGLRSVIRLETAEDDLQMLTKYYSADLPGNQDYRRRDVFTLLNNWSGEIDRARSFSPTQSMPSPVVRL